MNVSALNPLNWGSDDTDEPTIEQLEELFRRREATLDLDAVFHQPQPNIQDEETVVFPYTLYDQHDEKYGTGAKEFVVPDDGLRDTNAGVTQFLAGVTDTPTEDVGVSSFRDVEGAAASASLSDAGDVIVNAPEPPAAADGGEN